MIKLSPLQTDALKELFNVSVGRAAKVMSEIVNKEILLSIPELSILDRQEVIRLQSLHSMNVCSVSQHFQSETTGDGIAFLVFPENKSLEIVRMMMGDEITEMEMTDLESEAMIEIGNMIINACLGMIANITSKTLNFQLPTFYKGEIESLIPSEKDSVNFPEVFVAYINYSISGKEIDGYLLFLFEWKLIEFLGTELVKDIVE